jgi:hypothetical protein
MRHECILDLGAQHRLMTRPQVLASNLPTSIRPRKLPIDDLAAERLT